MSGILSFTRRGQPKTPEEINAARRSSGMDTAILSWVSQQREWSTRKDIVSHYANDAIAKEKALRVYEVMFDPNSIFAAARARWNKRETLAVASVHMSSPFLTIALAEAFLLNFRNTSRGGRLGLTKSVTGSLEKLEIDAIRNSLATDGRPSEYMGVTPPLPVSSPKAKPSGA